MNTHNLCCIGHITLDKIVTPKRTLHMPGAIVCGASVVAALESGIRIIAFAAVLGFWADIAHPCPAVGAVHQPGQAVGIGAVRHSRLFL